MKYNIYIFSSELFCFIYLLFGSGNWHIDSSFDFQMVTGYGNSLSVISG